MPSSPDKLFEPPRRGKRGAKGSGKKQPPGGERDFDLTIVRPGDDVPALFARLAKEGRLLTPIANLQEKPLPRQDFAAFPEEKDSLMAADLAVETIRLRLDEIHEPSSPGDRMALTVLALAYSRDCPIEARWTPDRPTLVGYPLLSGLGEVRTLLEDLAESQLLTRKPFDIVHLCGHCGSSRLNVREECERCASSNLARQSLIHHYRCAHQGPARDFERREGLVCPKCRERLRHYGVDYDRPSEIMECLACEHVMSEPSIGFVCGDCGERTPGDRIERRAWYHYDLTAEGLSALKSGILPAQSLSAMLERVVGTFSRRDFLMLATYAERTAARYDRPLAGCRLHLANADALRSEHGATGFNEILGLIGEVAAQILRSSDAIAVSGDTVYFLLAETDVRAAHVAFDRFSARVKSSVSTPIDFAFEAFGRDSWSRFLESIE